MRAWSFVPSGFGFCWLAAGLSALFPLRMGGWLLLTAGALLVAGSGLIGRRDRVKPFDRRAFRVGLIGEGLGIAAVLAVCIPLRRTDWIMPLIGMVVGLHFLPLARAFSDRRFIAAGCLMIGLSIFALAWSQPANTAIAGLGMGAVLWVSALWISLSPRVPASFKMRAT